MRVYQVLCIALLTIMSGTLAEEEAAQEEEEVVTICGVNEDQLLNATLEEVYTEATKLVSDGCEEKMAKLIGDIALRLMEAEHPKDKIYIEIDKPTIKSIKEEIFQEIPLKTIIEEGRKKENEDNMEFKFLIAISEMLIKNGVSDSTEWGKVDQKKMEETKDEIFKDETLLNIRMVKDSDSTQL